MDEFVAVVRLPNGLPQQMTIQADDGTEVTITQGDGYRIEPGHDGWVVGSEPCVLVDFSRQMVEYAKPR